MVESLHSDEEGVSDQVQRSFPLLFPVLFLIVSIVGRGNVWPGARAQGLGGCSVSLSDGLDGIFTNPAFLAELKETEFLVSYARQYRSGRSNHFQGAAARAFPFGGLGTGYLRSEGAGAEDAFILSHGRFLPYYLAAVGLNAKLIRYSPAEDDSFPGVPRRTALSLDLGFLFRFLALSFGYGHQNLVARDLSPDRDGEARPRVGKAFGLSYRRPEWIQWSLETSSLSRIADEFGFGAEVRWSSSFCGRIGIGRRRGGLGLGLDRQRWALDVSALMDEEMGNTYSLSLKWRMGRRFLFE